MSSAVVHIVDDDQAVRESLGDLLRSMDYQVTLYGSASEFLEVELPDTPACLVLDVRLPGTSGLELQEYLTRLKIRVPVRLASVVCRERLFSERKQGGVSLSGPRTSFSAVPRGCAPGR
jgi:FixJ family two-component response regulator